MMKRICIICASFLAIVLAIIGFAYFYLDFRLIKNGDDIYLDKVVYPDEIEKSYEDLTISFVYNGYILQDTLGSFGIKARCDDITGYGLVEDLTNVNVYIYVSDFNVLDNRLNARTHEAVQSELVKDDSKIYVTDYIEGNQIDTAKLVDSIFVDRKYPVTQSPNTVHFIIPMDTFIKDYDDSQQDTLQGKVDELYDFSIHYSNGTEIDVDDIIDFVSVSNNSISANLIGDDIKGIVQDCIESYNIEPSEMIFTTTEGTKVNMAGGTLKLEVDLDSEVDYVLDCFYNHNSDLYRVPTYTKPSYDYRNTGTYIEVSIEQQHLYYYKNGELAYDCDVVTGLANGRRDTTKGAFYIINKATDTILRGPTWETHVDYWMGVTFDGIGIHDATWRYKFGGTIYKTNGSHGCINVSLKDVRELFSIVEVDTPVMIY